MANARKQILQINVTINPSDITALEGPGGSVVSIPFGGTVEGEIFSGEVCPGACDVQTTNLAGVRHMLARYMLKGRDNEGNPCHIYIENNGWFKGEHAPGSTFDTVPTFLTDSKALAPYLHRNAFTGEGSPSPDGVTIKIFEIIN